MTTKTWIAAGLALALMGGGGFLAGRATAEDPKEGPPPAEKEIGAHPLVKALTGKWTIKGTSAMGESTGTSTLALTCGNTILLQDYASKSQMGDFRGLGVMKLGSDGKSGTLWWFDTYMPDVIKLAGKVSDTGYELEGDGPMGHMKAVMAPKGEGYEFRMTMDGQEMVDTYTRAK